MPTPPTMGAAGKESPVLTMEGGRVPGSQRGCWGSHHVAIKENVHYNNLIRLCIGGSTFSPKNSGHPPFFFIVIYMLQSSHTNLFLFDHLDRNVQLLWDYTWS